MCDISICIHLAKEPWLPGLAKGGAGMGKQKPIEAKGESHES